MATDTKSALVLCRARLTESIQRIDALEKQALDLRQALMGLAEEAQLAMQALNRMLEEFQPQKVHTPAALTRYHRRLQKAATALTGSLSLLTTIVHTHSGEILDYVRQRSQPAARKKK